MSVITREFGSSCQSVREVASSCHSVSSPDFGSAISSARSAQRPDTLSLARLATVRRASPQTVDLVDRIQQELNERAGSLKMKRAFDVIVAATGLVLLLPLLTSLFVAIRLTSRGPALFTQTREGLGRRPFQIFKFRTFCCDHTDHSGLSQPTASDARFTPVGGFLRRTNLDELPQLWNVLRGDMSLVGPRPHVPQMLANGRAYDELVPAYCLRLMVLPGITGLAQLRGFRGHTRDPRHARMRIVCDLIYIANQSFWFDLKILLLTIAAEVCCGGRGE
jgi:lipopolysaccharide/colanic/teichoic acid biosynthesis glycosyltransferase